MTTATATSTGFEELISRESNGISVSLLWNRHDNLLSVCVIDASTDTVFELEVEDAAPLDVFNHPYAYAAFRGVDTAPALEQHAEQPVAA